MQSNSKFFDPETKQLNVYKSIRVKQDESNSKYRVIEETENDMVLSQRFIQHISQFARTGNPNFQSVSYTWPDYNKASTVFMVDGEFTKNQTVDGFRKPFANFWNTFLPKLSVNVNPIDDSILSAFKNEDKSSFQSLPTKNDYSIFQKITNI